MTALDICNMALAMLNEPSISGIDQYGTLPQRLCWRNYHPVRRELLCGYHGVIWAFSVKTDTLQVAEDGTCEVPYNALRILDVMDKEANSLSQWSLKGRTLNALIPGAVVRYVEDDENSDEFPESFTEALACELALRMSPILLGSTSAAHTAHIVEKLKEITDKEKAAIASVPHRTKVGILYPL